MFHNNYTQEEYKTHHVILNADQEAGTGELLLGDLNAATDQQLMRKHNVKTIITAATGLQHLQIPSDQTHVVFPLLDLKTQNIQAYFELSNQTIDENLKKGGVLVHCGAGISRSATLVIAYYMKKYQQAFAPAIKHVRSCRPNVCPNLGFELQLKHYQDTLNLGQTKKQSSVISKELPNDNKKQFLQTKQMIMTFNAPTDNRPKASRMSHTNAKNFGNFTPNPMRKGAGYSSSKKKVEGDLQIVGQQMKKQWGWDEPVRHKGWGVRRDNHSFKL